MGAGVLSLGLGLGVLNAVPATAAQNVQTLTCDGDQIQIRSNTNNSSDHGGWAVAQVVDSPGGHLIPTQFAFSLTDDTVDPTTPLFSGTQVKGLGNAKPHSSTVNCTQSQTGTWDELQLGTPPPGVNPADTFTITFTATAVPKV
jgi:hypothetical protein